MGKLEVTWKGLNPLIMHSCRCVNPLDPIAIEMKKITSKAKRTEEDELMLSNLEWEAGVYWDDSVGGLYIPAENIEATIRNGAKSFRKGTDIVKYCRVPANQLRIPLNYYNNLTKEQLINDNYYRDVRAMKVPASKARVIRTRPRFNKWEITFNLEYDKDKIDASVIQRAMEYAGSYVGLCDSRPKYGTFAVITKELE